MEEEKIKRIFDSMAGITLLEWKKLSQVVETHFECEAAMQNNKIKMASPEKLFDSYKRSF